MYYNQYQNEFSPTSVYKESQVLASRAMSEFCGLASK